MRPKCEIDHNFYQYCDSNIGLFSITYLLVIALKPFPKFFVSGLFLVSSKSKIKLIVFASYNEEE